MNNNLHFKEITNIMLRLLGNIYWVLALTGTIRHGLKFHDLNAIEAGLRNQLPKQISSVGK